MKKTIKGYQKGITRARCVLAILFGVLCLLAPFTNSFKWLGYGVFYIFGSLWFYVTAILVLFYLVYKIIYLEKPKFFNWKILTSWSILSVVLRMFCVHISFFGNESFQNWNQFQSIYSLQSTKDLFGESKALGGVFGYTFASILNLGGNATFYIVTVLLLLLGLGFGLWDAGKWLLKKTKHNKVINDSKKVENNNKNKFDTSYNDYFKDEQELVEDKYFLNDDPFFQDISYDYEAKEELNEFKEISFIPAISSTPISEERMSRVETIAKERQETIASVSSQKQSDEFNKKEDEIKHDDIVNTFVNPYELFGEKIPERTFESMIEEAGPIMNDVQPNNSFNTLEKAKLSEDDNYLDIEESIEIVKNYEEKSNLVFNDSDKPFTTSLVKNIEESNFVLEDEEENSLDTNVFAAEEFTPHFGETELKQTIDEDYKRREDNFKKSLINNSDFMASNFDDNDEELEDNSYVDEFTMEDKTVQTIESSIDEIDDEELDDDEFDQPVVLAPKIEPQKPLTKEEQLGLLPAKEKKPYVLNLDGILLEYPDEEKKQVIQQQENEVRAKAIQEVLNEFQSGAYVDGYTIGPSVTRFHIRTREGVSMTSVNKYTKDISVKLRGTPARYEEIVQGLDSSGLEISNDTTCMVGFKEALEALPPVDDKHRMYIPFGKTISGEFACGDLSKFPHMLIAGSSGSGKSVYMQSILLSLIARNSPDDLRLVIIDPKRVEFNFYADIPHLVCPIVSEAPKAKTALERLVLEMERRYQVIELAHVRNIQDFNKRYCPKHNVQPLPYILCVIDEYADLVNECKDVATPVLRIAAKARAAGIHLIITTQRPDSSILNGTIKANLSTKVALLVSNTYDSQVILGQGGAEDLNGNGDMLISCKELTNKGFVRAQGCYVDDDEIYGVIDEICAYGKAEYYPEFLDLEPKVSTKPDKSQLSRDEIRALDDEMVYEDVKKWAMTREYISISKITAAFNMGYPRAKDMFQRLQDEGIIDELNPERSQSSKGTKVLVHEED